MMGDGTLIAIVDVDDAIPTGPLSCLLSDEDVLFVLTQNSCYLLRLHFCSSSSYWSFVSVNLFLPPNGVMISLGVLYHIPCRTCIPFYVLWYVGIPYALAQKLHG